MNAERPVAGSTESEILKYLDEFAPATVAEVAEHIHSLNGQARTTVLTTMERLRKKKGTLSRRKVEGVFRYSPKIPRDTRLRGLVENFVSRSLAGSIAPFVAFLHERESLSDAEFEELKQLVQQFEQRRQGDERRAIS